MKENSLNEEKEKDKSWDELGKRVSTMLTKDPGDLASEIEEQLGKNFKIKGMKLLTLLRSLPDIKFENNGIKAIAKIAAEVNASIENIGARRLYTILEKVFEDLSYFAPDQKEKTIIIDKEFVYKNLDKFVKSNDVSRYVL